MEVTCSHDGYTRLPGNVIHRRTWRVGNDRLRIEDFVDGRFRSAQARFLLHPAVAAASMAEGLLRDGASGGDWVLPSGKRIGWRLEAGCARFEPANYHPEFGLSQDTVRLVVDFPGARNAIEIAWN
jgi:hypothetical protein